MRLERFLLREVCALVATAVVVCAACSNGTHRDAPAAEHDADATDAASEDAGARGEGGVAGASVDAASGDAALDAGQDAAAPPPEVGADYLSWPALDIPPSGELTLSFDVPSAARAFVLTLDPRATPRHVQLLQVQGPSDALLFTHDAADGTNAIDPASTANVDAFEPYSLMLPSSPDVPLVPGRYRVQLAISGEQAPDAAPVAADIVWQRAAQTEPHRFPLVLWFVAGASLDAAGAQHDPQIQSALSLVQDIYASAGIDISPIDYRDLDTGDEEPFAVLDDGAELAALFASLSTHTDADRALSIVFVEHFDAGAGKTVRGKTTGLPIPPPHAHLPRRGGIAVPLDTLPDSAERIAELIAHEIGHALGLRHTSEYDGERHDPIADTPECPAERATLTTASGDSALSVEDCADLDGTNLLFYTPPQDDTLQRELTGGQTFVLRHNPLVH